MEARQIIDQLHASIDTDDLRTCLDAAAKARGASYSVLLGGGDQCSVFLSSPDHAPDLAHEDAVETIGRLMDAGTAVTPFEGGFGQASPPVSGASALEFRSENYGYFLVHGDDDPAWWNEVVHALSSEIIKVQLYEAASHESMTSGTKLEALHEAGSLLRYVDLEVLMTNLMEMSVRIMRAEVGAIVLDREGEIVTGSEWGLNLDVLLSFKTPEGESLLRSVLDSREPLFLADVNESGRVDTSELQVALSSIVIVPLVTQAKTLGAIVIVNAADGHLDAEDADVLQTAAALCSTALDNALLYEATKEHERIAAEMSLASGVQEGLFPKNALVTPEAEIQGWCITATETGGDLFDFFELDEHRIGICIADATGHGMGAALLTFTARATLHALLTHSEDLQYVMKTMNDLMEASSSDDRFLTCMLGILDRRTLSMRYASAGHDPPFICRPTNQNEVLELKTSGLPLGMFAGMDYETFEFQFEPGDFAVFGTDGIWEARNPAGEFFGKERLLDLVRSIHDQPLADASERIRREIIDFHEGGERYDDITALLLQVKRP